MKQTLNLCRIILFSTLNIIMIHVDILYCTKHDQVKNASVLNNSKQQDDKERWKRSVRREETLVFYFIFIALPVSTSTDHFSVICKWFFNNTGMQNNLKSFEPNNTFSKNVRSMLFRKFMTPKRERFDCRFCCILLPDLSLIRVINSQEARNKSLSALSK